MLAENRPTRPGNNSPNAEGLVLACGLPVPCNNEGLPIPFGGIKENKLMTPVTARARQLMNERIAERRCQIRSSWSTRERRQRAEQAHGAIRTLCVMISRHPLEES
jgi:hypothetical protein